jgi:hypothetical protein
MNWQDSVFMVSTSLPLGGVAYDSSCLQIPGQIVAEWNNFPGRLFLNEIGVMSRYFRKGGVSSGCLRKISRCLTGMSCVLDGFRFETLERGLKQGGILEMNLWVDGMAQIGYDSKELR